MQEYNLEGGVISGVVVDVVSLIDELTSVITKNYRDDNLTNLNNTDLDPVVTFVKDEIIPHITPTSNQDIQTKYKDLIKLITKTFCKINTENKIDNIDPFTKPNAEFNETVKEDIGNMKDVKATEQERAGQKLADVVAKRGAAETRAGIGTDRTLWQKPMTGFAANRESDEYKDVINLKKKEVEALRDVTKLAKAKLEEAKATREEAKATKEAGTKVEDAKTNLAAAKKKLVDATTRHASSADGQMTKAAAEVGLNKAHKERQDAEEAVKDAEEAVKKEAMAAGVAVATAEVAVNRAEEALRKAQASEPARTGGSRRNKNRKSKNIKSKRGKKGKRSKKTRKN